ncbi:Protein TOM71 (71 kDa mitochondrial outer membrane protein) [Durusdinium trenchii]|uniref:Protein TOM71 (71 kDa mitochondrial outer membrane protein) n=1 Tax=Durusdinium trenchii TaxID=1381693 RepID=A0ABP0PI36_9DINO
MAEGGYIESEPFEALQLKEEGNHFLKAGEFEPALDCYQRALTSLSQGGRGSAREVATVLGNVSCAQLSLGQPQLALEAARDAWRKDPSYSKALFREAKALLALGQFTDAVRAALHLLFLCGSSVEADVLKILEAAQEKPSQRPLQLGPATSAPSSSEATVESLQLVARCCDGEDLARLAQGNRRFWRQLSDQEVLDRAALVCPGASAGWLRRDATLGSAGWTFALHQAHGRSCVHDCVAVSTPGGALALVHLAADFTVLKEEALCTSGRCRSAPLRPSEVFLTLEELSQEMPTCPMPLLGGLDQ